MTFRITDLYPQVDVDSWTKRLGITSTLRGRCGVCNEKVAASIPYFNKRTAGLVAPTCACGNPTPYFVGVIRSKELNNNVEVGFFND